jgi:tripartite-type tricarboxylate transporter receptor subunit TctC
MHPVRKYLKMGALLGGSLLICAMAPKWAVALDYPVRPVRIIVAFAPGGANDILARLMGQWLGDRLGKQFLIENRPGGGGNIGTEAAIRSSKDGYTLFSVNPSNAINATLYEKLPYNFIADMAPVGGIMRVPNVLEVNPSLPMKTVDEFVAYAKANPGKLNMASAGIGTSTHLAGELFMMMTGVKLTHVPYRGNGPAVTDLMAGQVDVMFDTLPSSLEYIKAGKLRAIAVTSAQRSDALPDVPTIGETVPGYEASAFFGIGAPMGTPEEIVAKLNAEMNSILRDPKVKARLADLGGAVLLGTPAEFGKLISEETGKWAKVIKSSGAKAN